MGQLESLECSHLAIQSCGKPCAYELLKRQQEPKTENSYHHQRRSLHEACAICFTCTARSGNETGTSFKASLSMLAFCKSMIQDCCPGRHRTLLLYADRHISSCLGKRLLHELTSAWPSPPLPLDPFTPCITEILSWYLVLVCRHGLYFDPNKVARQTRGPRMQEEAPPHPCMCCLAAIGGRK